MEVYPVVGGPTLLGLQTEPKQEVFFHIPPRADRWRGAVPMKPESITARGGLLDIKGHTTENGRTPVEIHGYNPSSSTGKEIIIH